MLSVNQVLDQQLTRPEEEVEYEEEMAEDAVTFFYGLKGLKLARKYMWRIGIDSIIAMCYKLENELYRKEKNSAYWLLK